ncbi:MAG: hypothetical protein FWC26_02505 [Fibromonadales bacterium]|nr:hypothetical protein [Fibromonadales bacterium]
MADHVPKKNAALAFPVKATQDSMPRPDNALDASLLFPMAVRDNTYVKPPYPPEDDRPIHIKLAGMLMPEGNFKKRFNVVPYSKQQAYNEETFSKTHADVFRERLGAFEGLEAMGDSLDEEHNLPMGTFLGVPTPMGAYNKYHKEELRKAFDDMGIERKH